MVKRIPEVPGASLADIAFMLLIFFLVTTTMDVDSGLRRVLPPMPLDVPENTEKKERNVFVVLVDQNNRLMVEGELMGNVNDLRGKAKEFLENPNNASNLPEKETKTIPYFGEYLISPKAIISLWNDVGTQYGTYITVQNELVGAINELRNELAISKFGKSYESLDEDRKNAVRMIYPQKISEAEPRKIGD